MSRRGTFDYILLETSGLADPGNLAPLFWVDDGLGSTIYLDGIVTLVDAKNILLSLDEKSVETEHEGTHMTTAHLQISHADVIVVNKCDSVTAEQLAMVEERITGINGLAKIHRTRYSQVPQLESFLLDLHAYDGVASLDAMSKGHSHLDPVMRLFLSFPFPSLSPLSFYLRHANCFDASSPYLILTTPSMHPDHLNNNPPPPPSHAPPAPMPRILAPLRLLGVRPPRTTGPRHRTKPRIRNPQAQRPRLHHHRQRQDDSGREGGF